MASSPPALFRVHWVVPYLEVVSSLKRDPFVRNRISLDLGSENESRGGELRIAPAGPAVARFRARRHDILLVESTMDHALSFLPFSAWPLCE